MNLAKDFGVAADDAQSFARTRSRLRLAGGLGAGVAGVFTVATGGLVPGLFVVGAATLASRKAIDRFLPSFFQKPNNPNPSS